MKLEIGDTLTAKQNWAHSGVEEFTAGKEYTVHQFSGTRHPIFIDNSGDGHLLDGNKLSIIFGEQETGTVDATDAFDDAMSIIQ